MWTRRGSQHSAAGLPDNRGAAAVEAIVALGLVAAACSVIAVSARVGLSASVAAAGTVRAVLAAEQALEALLGEDLVSLAASGSGTLAGVDGAIRSWRAQPLAQGLVSLEVDVLWEDTRPHSLTLRTVAVP